MNVVTLLAALEFAADKHRHQKRKDAEASPYVNHLIAVTSILAAEGSVKDEAALLAAVLHDTVEDTDTTFVELDARFGAMVAQLVGEVTDDKTLLKAVRKQHRDEQVLLVRVDTHVRDNVFHDRLPSMRLWRPQALTRDSGGSVHRVECVQHYNVTMESRSFQIV